MADVPPFLWSDVGTFSSPVTYTVPGAGEVQPYTATATYVNASGQAIRPAIRIKSSEGALLALVFPSDTIADGTSSEVTFVPPFGSASTSSPATSSAVQAATLVGGVDEGGTNQTVFAGGNDPITFSPTIFQTDGGSVFGVKAGVQHTITIFEPGLYMAIFSTSFTTEPNLSDVSVGISWANSTGQTVWQTTDPPGYPIGGLSGASYGFDGASATTIEVVQAIGFAWINTASVAAPGDCEASLSNNTAGNLVLNARTLHVMQLRAMTAADFAGFPFNYP